MPPELLKAGLRIAILVLVAGLAMLPFQDRTKAEFYVSLLAAIIGGLYVLAIWLVIRRGLPRPPATSRIVTRRRERDRMTGPSDR